MAGRGKNATLPSWMTNGSISSTQTLEQQNINEENFNLITQNNSIEVVQKTDFSRNENILKYEINGTPSKDRANRRRSTSRSRDKSHRRRSKSRSRDRDRDRTKSRPERSARSRSPEQKGIWKSKRNLKESNFDVRPVDGIEPVGVGLVTAGSGSSQNAMMKFPDQQVSYVLERYTGLVNTPKNNSSSSGNINLLGTQNARRLYVGGITTDTTDIELTAFFSDVIKNAIENTYPQDFNDPVVQVYMNREKCFAFVELRSVELTTACCSLDGVKFTNRSGITVTLRIRRPNDFKPELMHGLSLNPIPRVDLHKLGLVSSLVSPESAERIFVGGLPYHLTDDNVKELLSVFGPLKSFHLVRDAASVTSKGYGFCEYYDNATAQAAIDGLNGMAIGEKNLTVKFASPPGTLPPKPAGLPQYNNPIIASMVQPQVFYQPQPTAAPQGPQPLSIHTLQYTPPTRVLLLSNMVTSAEIADDQEFFDILEDVKAECEAFGQVNSVIAPRRKDGYLCEGNIYVEFVLPSQSKVASQSLIGRRFAERTVAVSYYDESLFSRRQFI